MIHLRPLPSAEIAVPAALFAGGDEARLAERVRRHVRGIVAGLKIGGGLGDERAWQAVVDGFLDEIAARLALEPLADLPDHLAYVSDRLSRRAIEEARRNAEIVA